MYRTKTKVIVAGRGLQHVDGRAVDATTRSLFHSAESISYRKVSFLAVQNSSIGDLVTD